VAATNLEKLQEDQEIFTYSKGPAGNMVCIYVYLTV
jgi:hypothetical protein